MKPEIHIFKNTRAMGMWTGEMVQRKAAASSSVSLALSGGSTPEAIFMLWSEKFQTGIPWRSLKIFWGDERCVAPDDPESNYRMASNALLKNISVPAARIFRIQGEQPPEKEAARYADILLREVPAYNGVPGFDVLMLGIGQDGHIASIFPDQMDLWNAESLCAVAKHPVSGQLRITITGKMIVSARTVLVLATGENKSEIIREVLKPADPSLRYPASNLLSAAGRVLWLLDEAAAELL